MVLGVACDKVPLVRCYGRAFYVDAMRRKGFLPGCNVEGRSSTVFVGAPSCRQRGEKISC
jgi:hypothetical protein